jgi:hypothetical protein
LLPEPQRFSKRVGVLDSSVRFVDQAGFGAAENLLPAQPVGGDQNDVPSFQRRQAIRSLNGRRDQEPKSHRDQTGKAMHEGSIDQGTRFANAKPVLPTDRIGTPAKFWKAPVRW